MFCAVSVCNNNKIMTTSCSKLNQYCVQNSGFCAKQIHFPALNDGFLYDTMAATAEDATNTKCHLGDICQQNLASAVISICNRCLSLSSESTAKWSCIHSSKQAAKWNKWRKRKRWKITESRGEADTVGVWTGRWDVITVWNEQRKEY